MGKPGKSIAINAVTAKCGIKDMKLENQVCTLGQAKRLKEFGVNQKVAHYFWDESDGQLYRSVDGSAADIGCFAAFTVAELGIMLPNYYPAWRFPANGREMYIATVICSPKPKGVDNINTSSAFDRIGETQAEAMATLLIALIDVGHIKPEECNQRIAA